MKKIYLFLSLLFCMTTFAQEKLTLRGTEVTRFQTAKDFTVKDINGNTHHLYEYLEQGKFVVLDFFATWCAPCWGYHNEKILEDLYKLKGEGGSGEFVILSIEADPRTSIDDIKGTGSMTKGDWTEGTLYPICELSDSTGYVAIDYNITRFPTVIMIAPNANKDMRTVGPLLRPEYYVRVSEDFVMDDEAPVPAFYCNTYSIKGSELSFKNDTQGVVDSYKWTFEGGTPATSTEKEPKVKFNTNGVFEITLEVTNANGSNKKTKTIRILDPADFDPYVENFERIGAFTEGYSHWKSVDIDKKRVYGVNEVDYMNESNPAGFLIFNPSETIPTFPLSCKEGSQMGMSISPSDKSQANDWFISPKLKIDKSMALKFWAQTPIKSGGESKFRVCVSTTDDNPDNFTKINEGDYISSGKDWKEFSFDLSAYEGQEIHIAINSISKSFFFFIDDLRVISTEGVDEIKNKTKIFTVPSNNMVYVSSEFEFEGYKVYNQLGQLILQQKGEAKAFNINVSELESGIYFIHLNGKKGNVNKKIIIE